MVGLSIRCRVELRMGLMEPADLPHRPPEPPADDHLLEDLAAVTGLLNPERIWQEELQLDDLDEARAKQEQTPAPDAPAAD